MDSFGEEELERFANDRGLVWKIGFASHGWAAVSETREKRTVAFGEKLTKRGARKEAKRVILQREAVEALLYPND